VIGGKRIIPSDMGSVESQVARDGVREIILSADVPTSQRALLGQLCLRMGVQVTEVPPPSQWIRGAPRRDQLRGMSIESLLGRDRIELLGQESRSCLEGKVMLVTGAAGSIGSDLCRQLCRYGIGRLVLLDQSETGLHDILSELTRLAPGLEIRVELASIRDRGRVDGIFRRHRPHYVFHAAAYKHVPILEGHPSEVVLTNVHGTMNLADAARANGVEKFVMVSTDKAVNPANLMGACKRVAEIYVQSIPPDCATQFITTRFGNVLGSSGSVVPMFSRQIAHGGPLTVTHRDITRYFMTIPEATSLVLEAAVIGGGGEIFVFDMGRPVRILDLAEKMVRLAGLTPGRDIPIEFTGLRPGEKMYEELFKSTESLLGTHHPRIMRAKRDDADPGFRGMLDCLVRAATGYDDWAIRGILRAIVPEYRPEGPACDLFPVPLSDHDAIQPDHMPA
jgi:FlaA1/EpsC-like NDP-sugar epimerase